MRGARNHFAEVAVLRQLAGMELPVHKRIAGCCDAADQLAKGMRSWRAFAPRRTTLDQSIAQADAVARSLRELRTALHAEGGPDAA
jgi:hypothetical protein